MANPSKFLGAGFAQGLGQSLGQLPQLLMAIQQAEQAEEDRALITQLKKQQLDIGKRKLDIADRELKLQESQAPVQQRLNEAALEAWTQAMGERGLEAGGEAEPQPSGLRGAMAGGGGSSGVQFLPQFNMGPSGMSMGLRPQLPPEAQRTAEAAVKALGFDPATPEGQDAVSRLLFAERLPESARGPFLEALQGGRTGSIAEARRMGRQEKLEDIGATAATKAAIELRTKPQIAAATAGAQTRAKLGAEREPVRALLGRLKETLGKINLPKTGGERMTAAPRLLGESVMQTNENLVLFETLKEGFLAAVVRAAGERGTLTDQDIGRARALMPNALPGPGVLPDTQSIAKKKLEQLEQLLGDFGQKDPILAQELGQVVEQVKSRKGRGARTAEPGRVPGRPRILGIKPVK